MVEVLYFEDVVSLAGAGSVLASAALFSASVRRVLITPSRLR
jgi:hypothetical protein